MVHIHPRSRAKIEGIRLAPGVELLRTDCYDSHDGEWEECPCPGVVLTAGCTTVWIRPHLEISLHARQLLVYISSHNFLITDFGRRDHFGNPWKVIPTPHWKNDGRMDWTVRHPEYVQDLINSGYILQDQFDSDIYRVTEGGHEFVKSLAN